jgi:hypothetical protein
VLDTANQKAASRFWASSRPPLIKPSASITALTAPAEVPEMPSIASRSSQSNCSSTPHVKAPCAPPPCKARLMRFTFDAGSFSVAFSAERLDSSDDRILIMRAISAPSCSNENDHSAV